MRTGSYPPDSNEYEKRFYENLKEDQNINNLLKVFK